MRQAGNAAQMRRVWALIKKEVRQVVRDPSSIAIGIVMPVVLILLFGYGMSLDVTNVPVALVLEDPAPAATDLASSFELSPYFAAQRTSSMRHAEQLMLARKVDGIVRIRPDFSRTTQISGCSQQPAILTVKAAY